MTIPDYQSFMLPFLKILGDRNEHTLQEIYIKLADYFKLTESDRKEYLPSGKQLKYKNRIGWARTYLKKSGLLDQVGRGIFTITERGLNVLNENPEKIDVKFLEQFNEFLKFQGNKNSNTDQIGENKKLPSNLELDLSPEEILDTSYREIRRDLMDELLHTVKSCSPEFFEKLVVDLLIAMGYGGTHADAGQAIGKSGDDGIDGIIKEDKLGLDVIYIQAKRWEGSVGRPAVQAFAGSLEGNRARKGVFITTSRFTEDAKEYVKRIEKKIVLIDGESLAELMIDNDVGVSPKVTYIIKNIDSDYFNED
ncbi:restriction endonuclease [Weizmannia agrestimuris]|uniref:restriction endonuclease n=1 Tax=Weizmannia agrestimuris TaxID=2941342 RepID=UPI00203F95CC|nr:restriction endonuclease [Weizmannia agrestimuris]